MTAIAPRVLIVDDEPQLVRGLKIMLRTAGYVVETARTALDMLAILAAHPPDVLVLDFVLPDGQGVEVCKQVRRCSKLPILIMSAIGEEREKVRALDAGADDYLAKPFRGEELLARLRGVLQRSVAGSGSSTLEIGELVIDLARAAGDPRWRGRAPRADRVRDRPRPRAASTGGSLPTDSSCGRRGGLNTSSKRITSVSASRKSARNWSATRRIRST